MSGITRLSLSHFRSYQHLRLECDTRPVVLTGPNGAGKTNILEAISFLSPGRGLRSIKLSEALHRGHEAKIWSVAASCTTLHGPLEVGTGFEEGEEGASDKRIVRINKDTVRSQAQLGEYVRMLWITPQMDRLFIDGSTAKRRFLDRLVYTFDPEHAGRVLRYEHVMRERLRLLKQGGGQKAWLEALEQKMAESGVSIAAARLQTLEILKQAKAWALGIFPLAALSIEGETEADLSVCAALEAEERLLDRLGQSRGADQESGRTLKGPHRSDLKVLFVDKNCPAEYCSTGEQKALLVSIILAASRLQALKGEHVPLLLLDEVVAHLDEARRRALFQEILNLNIQAWMTGTDSSTFQEFREQMQHFKIVEGHLERL
jgi:DNA replication and repair protein RecF